MKKTKTVEKTNFNEIAGNICMTLIWILGIIAVTLIIYLGWGKTAPIDRNEKKCEINYTIQENDRYIDEHYKDGKIANYTSIGNCTNEEIQYFLAKNP